MQIKLERAFVLHRRNYRETSLLVEVFSESFGRLGLVAKGARRGRGTQGHQLQPFRPLLLSWRDAGELGTLAGVETDGRAIPLAGRLVSCGFYINELLMRLLHRHDPHADLFDYYREAISNLSTPGREERVLRVFEKRLLGAIGYGLLLDREAETGRPVRPEQVYAYDPQRGPLAGDTTVQAAVRVRGETLLALAEESLEDPDVLREAKRLMRVVLHRYLGEKPLASRALFRSRR